MTQKGMFMASVSLLKIIEKMKLENLTPEIDLTGIKITQPDINRPALQLAGYFEHYEASRNGAANGGNTDGSAFNAQLVNDLGNQSVNNAVGTAGAVVQRNIRQSLGLFKYNCHG